MKKFLALILVLTLVVAVLPVPALAFSDVTEETQVILHEDPGVAQPRSEVCREDIYGATGWSSLSAAKAYYGLGFTYTYCGGNPYNYYYTFSDGSRMYFGVKG